MSGNELIEKLDTATGSLIAKWIRNGFFGLACLILNDMRSDIKTGLQSIGALDTRVTVVENKVEANTLADSRLAGRVETISDNVNKAR